MTFRSTLHLIYLLSRKPNTRKGFTLIELLVSVLIGSVIISGLLYLTNELLTVDQKESNKTETQRDLKNALDFMTAELQKAVYVYENADCLVGNTGVSCDDGANQDALVFAENIEPFPPYPNATTTPVLAFWKQTPLPDALVQQCATQPNDPAGVVCLNGSSYSLIVYAYSENEGDNGPWEGKAGILRYAMEVGGNGTYVSPIQNGGPPNFRRWPDPPANADGQGDNAAFAPPEILVDFVDDLQSANPSVRENRFCPDADANLGLPSYHASPAGANAHRFPDDLGGFYACVNQTDALTGQDANTRSGSSASGGPPIYGYGNQDVVVYLQGNAFGRSGLMGEKSFTETLETRVFVRGVLNR